MCMNQDKNGKGFEKLNFEAESERWFEKLLRLAATYGCMNLIFAKIEFRFLFAVNYYHKGSILDVAADLDPPLTFLWNVF